MAAWLRAAAAGLLAVALPAQALAAPAPAACAPISALIRQHPDLTQAYPGLQQAADRCAAGGGLGFTDLAGYGWAEGDVGVMQATDIMNGVGGGRFQPGGTVTRVQLAALLARTFRLGAPVAATAFNDVGVAYWGYAPVEAAAPFLGRLATPTGPAFAPDLPVTRADVAAALGQLEVAEGLAQLPTPAQAEAVWAAFADGAAVPAALSQYAAVAVQAQLMQGYGDGSFGPGDTLTRAEAAVLLTRVLAGAATAPAASAVQGSVRSASSTQLVLTAGGAALALQPAPGGAPVILDGSPASLAALRAGDTATATLNAAGQVLSVEASSAGRGTAALTGSVESATASAITLTVAGMQLTVTVAPGTSLGGATAGTVTLNAAGQVVGVTAATTVAGTVASASGTTVTLSVNGAMRSLTLAGGATVTLNGHAASLADLAAGDPATATLSPAGQVTALAATGQPATVTGTVASVGFDSLAIAANGAILTYGLAPGATVTLNGGSSSLGALALGDGVTATLNGQGEVQSLAATGTASPSSLKGTVQGVNSYALVLKVNGTARALPLATGVNVTLNGQVTGIASVVAGDTATVNLNSAGQVVNIALSTGTSIITGSVVAVSAATQPSTLLLNVGGSVQTFVIAPGTPVTVGGVAASLGDLTAGETATLTLNTAANLVTAVTAATHTASGYVVAESASSVTVAAHGSGGATATTYPIAAGAQITLNGATGSASTLPLGAAVAVGLGTGGTATSIAASTPRNQISGVLQSVSASQAILDINGTPAPIVLGPNPAAFSGGGEVAVTALPVGQTVTIDPTAMGGSALLVR